MFQNIKKITVKAGRRRAMVYIIACIIFSPFASLSQSVKKALVDGEGLPVVMLPGGLTDISKLAPHAEDLSKNYKVIRMEHFNVQYGDENRELPADYSVKMESEAIGKTLDSLKISTPVVLVGSSYGAVIAFDFALDHPEKIHSLVLFEPPLFWIAGLKNESPQGMKKAQILGATFLPSATITEQDVKEFRCEFLNCDSIDITKHPQWSTWLLQKDRMRGLAAVPKYKSEISRLHDFKKPVLIMNGNSTVLFHKRINELLAPEFPNAIQKQIPGGHGAPVTSSEEFVQALRDFIKQVK